GDDLLCRRQLRQVAALRPAGRARRAQPVHVAGPGAAGCGRGQAWRLAARPHEPPGRLSRDVRLSVPDRAEAVLGRPRPLALRLPVCNTGITPAMRSRCLYLICCTYISNMLV